MTKTSLGDKVVRFLTVLAIAAIFCFAGCGDEDDNPSGGGADTVVVAPEYTGVLDFSRLENGFRIDRSDSVTLTISQDTYTFVHHTDHTRLCDTQGDVAINTQTGFMTFDPSISNLLGVSCDTLRIPIGVFIAQFTDSSLNLAGERTVRNALGVVIDTVFYDYRLKAVRATSVPRL
jgi:hypothetical protein